VLKPIAKTSYEKISDKTGDVAKEVAEQSMKDAANELREGKRSGKGVKKSLILVYHVTVRGKNVVSSP